MYIEPRHFMTEHYTSPERLSHHFAAGWTILLTLRTDEFTEHTTSASCTTTPTAWACS